MLEARGEFAAGPVADHLATAAELVAELGPVPGVRADIREQAVDALAPRPRNAEEVESWVVSGRHHDRALGLLSADPCERRWTRAARPGPQPPRATRGRTTAATTRSSCSKRRAKRENVRFKAAALTMLGELYAASGDYDEAERTLSRSGAGVARGRRRVRRRQRAARARHVAPVPRRAQRGRRARSPKRSPRTATKATGAARRGRCRTSRGSRSHAATSPTAERRLQESAELFGELGDWGGLGWAFGLLAFVRYNQGRLDEAAELAEQIAVEGLETGNRWAVGMMDVLLANVALWRGRTREAVHEGRDAVKLFQEIDDRWGEIQATAPVVRALAELGEREESETALARMREVGRHAAVRRDAARPRRRAGEHLPAVRPSRRSGRGLAQPARSGAAWRSATAITTPRTDCSSCSSDRVDDAIALLEPQYASGGVRRRRDEHGQPPRARLRGRRADPSTRSASSASCRTAPAARITTACSRSGPKPRRTRRPAARPAPRSTPRTRSRRAPTRRSSTRIAAHARARRARSDRRSRRGRDPRRRRPSARRARHHRRGLDDDLRPRPAL